MPMRAQTPAAAHRPWSGRGGVAGRTSSRCVICSRCSNAHTAADISSPLWGVSDVALRGFELRGGRVILSRVYDAPEAMKPT
jgi:hypothetical protein